MFAPGIVGRSGGLGRGVGAPLSTTGRMRVGGEAFSFRWSSQVKTFCYLTGLSGIVRRA